MPYRALTHGRVRGAQTAPANAHTNQVKAIDSQKGVGNSGPIRKTNLIHCRQECTTFLMPKNAYGVGRFSPGQGKGFPEATPLPSVGSVNRFARRAIARRAVTKRIGVKGSENCCEHKLQPLNLVQSFTVGQAIALQNINNIPLMDLELLSGDSLDPNTLLSAKVNYNPAALADNMVIFWGPAYASNSSLGSTDDWGNIDYQGGNGAKGSLIAFSYDSGFGEYNFVIQIARPVGLRKSLIHQETSYTKDFMVKLTVKRASTTTAHDAGDVQVILNHKVKATQMESGGVNSQNRAVLQFVNSTASNNPGNTDNGTFEGVVNFNYSDIDFSDATKRLQLNDVLTLSITEA